MIKKVLTELKWILVGTLGKIIIDLLFFTTRIKILRSEKVDELIQSRKLIFAFWHSRILMISYLQKWINAAILVSQSDDGEIIARILQKQGHETIRGSSRRGGLEALLELIKNIKENRRPGAIVPDGPQGPRCKVQPGAVLLAKATGYPLVPFSYSAKKMKVFSSWDRFILPFPFTSCRVVYGDPIYVPKDIKKEEEKEYISKLENELNRITVDADSYFGHHIS